jgi:ribosomal 50S subunit-associated protein YjgA (DUF615 family)
LDLQVRPLKTKDFFKVASILGKMTKTALSELSFTTDEKKIGFVFVHSAFQYAETDIRELLADLVNIKPAELDELPFDTPLLIIEKLQEQEDLKRFFTKVGRLMNKNELLH